MFFLYGDPHIPGLPVIRRSGLSGPSSRRSDQAEEGATKEEGLDTRVGKCTVF